MTDRELMQMALDALDNYGFMPLEDEIGWQHFKKTIEALRTRLAQPEQPQIVWIDNKQTGNFLNMAPPQREWQGLTDEEIKHVNEKTRSIFVYARAIEAKLKEKNT